MLWKIQLAASVFANLCLIEELNHVLLVNVKGLVTLCHTGNGQIVSVFLKLVKTLRESLHSRMKCILALIAYNDFRILTSVEFQL